MPDYYKITPEKIAAIVKMEMRIKQVPFNETLHDLGATSAHLHRIQSRLGKEFHRTVGTLFFSDTVYSIEEKLNQQHKNYERTLH